MNPGTVLLCRHYESASQKEKKKNPNYTRFS